MKRQDLKNAAYDVGVGNSGMIQELTERVESSVNEGNIAHLPFIKGYSRFEKNECKKRKCTPSRRKTDAKTRTDDVEGKADLQAKSNMEDLISDNDDFFLTVGQLKDEHDELQGKLIDIQ